MSDLSKKIEELVTGKAEYSEAYLSENNVLPFLPVGSRIDEPEEARKWPLKYACAHDLRIGSYLILMGSYHRIYELAEEGGEMFISAEGLDHVLICDSAQGCWSLVKPRSVDSAS